MGFWYWKWNGFERWWLSGSMFQVISLFSLVYSCRTVILDIYYTTVIWQFNRWLTLSIETALALCGPLTWEPSLNFADLFSHLPPFSFIFIHRPSLDVRKPMLVQEWWWRTESWSFLPSQRGHHRQPRRRWWEFSQKFPRIFSAFSSNFTRVVYGREHL